MNQRHSYRVLGLAAACLAGALPAGALTLRCPPDSVKVGDLCVDTYEASVWQIPASNTGLVRLVQAGRATLADLTSGGATQLNPGSNFLADPGVGTPPPVFPPTFPTNGQWTAPLYAASIAGVQPAASVSWFQADEACALSVKRLLTNAEWQRAAAGTPASPDGSDNGISDCNINSVFETVPTGSRPSCKSNWGAFDMVGNVAEWVANWVPRSSGCAGWGAFSTDSMCLSGADPMAIGPGALIRGGRFTPAGTVAGVFAIHGDNGPALALPFMGFRCARSFGAP